MERYSGSGGGLTKPGISLKKKKNRLKNVFVI